VSSNSVSTVFQFRYQSIMTPQTASENGSFELLDLLQSAGEEEGHLTLALLVAIRKKVTHGIRLGRCLSRIAHDVVDVFFMEVVKEGANHFRRVGVGSLFEIEIIDAFWRSEDVESTIV
jgi:hypothetical protein